MKKIILLLTLALAAQVLYAQSDLKARLELEKAEEAYSQERYEPTLSHIEAAEKLLGGYSLRIAHLKIITLDKLCDYADPQSATFVRLQGEVKKYIANAEKNKKTVVMEKFREVYAIGERVDKEGQAQAAWAKVDPSDEGAVRSFAAQYAGSAIADRQADRLNRQARATRAIAGMGGAGISQADYRAAAGILETALANGDLSAAAKLGDMYRNGYGVKSDYGRALEYYLMAAEGGDAESIRRLADFYRTRLFDYPEAEKWYTVLADRGDAQAMLSIGKLYYKGEDESRFYRKNDPEKAQPWFEKAAALGNADAVANLGHIKYSATSWTFTKTGGEARDLYAEAIEKGSSDGLYYWGYYTLKHRGLWGNKSEKEALELALKAAEMGNTGAMCLAASIYYYDKDVTKPLEWRMNALKADTDIPQVYYEIGLYYYNGSRGLPKSTQKAIPWFRLFSRMCDQPKKVGELSAASVLEKENVTDDPTQTFDELRNAAWAQLLADIGRK